MFDFFLLDDLQIATGLEKWVGISGLERTVVFTSQRSTPPGKAESTWTRAEQFRLRDFQLRKSCSQRGTTTWGQVLSEGKDPPTNTSCYLRAKWKATTALTNRVRCGFGLNTRRPHLKEGNISNKNPDVQLLQKFQSFQQCCVRIPTWPPSAGLSHG